MSSRADAIDAAPSFGPLQRVLRARLLATMDGLRDCRLVLEDALGTQVLGTPAAREADTLHVRVRVHDPDFYRQVALNGSVGAGEAYMDGLWDCDAPGALHGEGLVALVRILVRNRDRLDALGRGTARLGALAMRVAHAFMRNTRAGSRRNIAAHYDLGNALYQLFLDRNLMYSAAIFEGEHESLEAAQERKLERICAKLGLQPHHHVVEIGSGWGGFALHAARRHGCRVTTTTISRAQYQLASERIAAAGLSDRVTVLLQDYRDLEGRYDRLVSIEMIEAIGHQYLDTYFRKLGALLVDDGLALVQAITIEDRRYARALRTVDFIKRHVFPGSFIPSISAMHGALVRASDLRLTHLEDIGPSYALTLKAWRERFMARLPEVAALGYDVRFVRLWEFYLAYCEGAFRERSIGDVQLLLAKPGSRAPEFVPPLRG
jgi:cyclopropane-fatty-acyl-phospholipid synthase